MLMLGYLLLYKKKKIFYNQSLHLFPKPYSKTNLLCHGYSIVRPSCVFWVFERYKNEELKEHVY